MTSVDVRTRAQGVARYTDPETFWSEEVQDLLDRNGRLVVRGMMLLN